MVKRVDAEARNWLGRLAAAVRNEIAAAGLPVMAPDILPTVAVGADIYIDDEDGPAGGVFVAWKASPRLRERAVDAVRHKRLDDPLLSHAGTVNDAMSRSIIEILASAGFTVEDANDEYRPYHVRIRAAPARGLRPSWDTTDDELTMPGWAADGDRTR